MLRKTLWSFLLASMICVPAAIGESGVSESEIVIGNPNVQSGDNEFAGKQTTIGLESCVKAANEQGGINGRKIRLITCDDKYSVEGAESCFEKLLSMQVFALAGLVGSAPLTKYIPLCTNHNIPLLGTYSGPQMVCDPVKHMVFTVRRGYQDEEQEFVDHLWDDVGIRQFGIIYQNDAYGQDHLKGMTDALKKHGAKVAAAASYQRNTNDLSVAFKTLRASNVEAVSLAANHNQCAAIIKMARETSWHPLFFINSGANLDGFIPEVGADGNGVLVSETVPPPYRIDLTLVIHYRDALKKYFPAEKPCFTSLRGYLVGTVMIEALKRAGKNLTRESFVAALEQLHDLDVGLGQQFLVSYSPKDHWGLHHYSFGLLKDGFIIPVTSWAKLKQK
jgi:ABC-type branched-subunit amino acid transport system substrate-binding protein